MISNSTKQSISIIVDADSCPVVEEIARTGEEYGIQVVLVASVAHFGYRSIVAQKIYVDSVPQAADLAIVNMVSKGDIVVTGDYGLASLVLAKGAKPISPRGHIYTEDNIERLLVERHVNAKIRQSGGRTKGPKAFTGADKLKFRSKLCRLVEGQLKALETPIS